MKKIALIATCTVHVFGDDVPDAKLVFNDWSLCPDTKLVFNDWLLSLTPSWVLMILMIGCFVA